MSDDDRSAYDAFERARRTYGGRPFLHIPATCAGGSADLTYDQAGVAVAETATNYKRAGYGASHHVALLLESRADFFIHWLALNSIGATVVPLGSDLARDEAIYLLRHADVDLLLYLPERRALAEQTADQIDGLVLATPRALQSNEVPRACEARSGDHQCNGAAIVYTSGSTGLPKGCVLSNDYFLSFGRWYRDLGGRCALGRGIERLITPLPLNHVNALAFSSMGMILTGGCIIQLDRFRSSDWWSTVITARATVMHYLGVMPAMLLQLPSSSMDRGHSLRFGFGGGVRLTHHEPFEERFGVPLIEAWAMTETGGTGTISTHVGPRHQGSGCIGQPSPNFSEARIVDENGESQAPNEVGELVVRAPGENPRKGFFSGYYKDPSATDAAWLGGWLHTGDLARRGLDGSFFFVGRRKQIIRRSGENISAAEVETVLSADARISSVAVVGVPDEIREQEVFACVVAKAEVTPADDVARLILSAAAERLAYYKLPGYIAFVESLPMTSTQKLRYGAVTDLARSLLAGHGVDLFDLREAKAGYRRALRAT